MALAKIAVIERPRVVALVTARANGRRLFLRWGRENCTGLAAW